LKNSPKKGREDYQGLASTAINDSKERHKNVIKQLYFYMLWRESPVIYSRWV